MRARQSRGSHATTIARTDLGFLTMGEQVRDIHGGECRIGDKCALGVARIDREGDRGLIQP